MDFSASFNENSKLQNKYLYDQNNTIIEVDDENTLEFSNELIEMSGDP